MPHEVPCKHFLLHIAGEQAHYLDFLCRAVKVCST